MLQPGDFPVLAGNTLGAVEPEGGGFGQNVIDQRAFAGAGHAADHRQQADREAHIDLLQIMFGRTDNFQRFGFGPQRGGIFLNFQGTAQVGPGAAGAGGEGCPGRSLEYQFTSLDTRTRPQFNQVIRRTHGLGIVFDHHHGVAPLAQSGERLD